MKMSKISSNISNQLDPKHIEDFDITDDVLNIPNDDDAPLMGFSSLNKDMHLNGGREDAKEQNMENKNQWNIKQTFSKNNPFNDTQLGIITKYKVVENVCFKDFMMTVVD